MKKFFPYLLLNIVVSALTMLSVLLIWNVSHPISSAVLEEDALSILATPDKTVQPLPAMNARTVEITAIFMPGDIEFEKLTIHCTADSPINLEGWSITDGQGNKYIFPSLMIFPDGAVDLFSHSGINSAVELFWNSSDAIWSSGEIAILRDYEGNTRFRFTTQ